MALTVLIEGVDKTSLVQAKSLDILLRADQRSSVNLVLMTTAAGYLPKVGYDIEIDDSITAEAVGTGDGTEDTFYLDCIPVKAASETIKLNGVTTAAYTLDDASGEIVFTSPPGLGVAITADYTGVVFGGVIKSCPQERPGKGGEGAASPVRVTVYSDGYHAIPARRTLATDWVNETAGDIVTECVTDYLSTEGVTAGTISTGATVSRYKRRIASIKEIFDDLAKLSGFKWWIDHTKALHFAQEAPVTDAAHSLTEGGTFTDFGDVRVEEQLENYRNKIFVKGGVLETGATYAYIVEDSAEIAARAAIEGGTGVYGYVHDDPNILNDIDADVVADNLLKRYGRVPTVLTFWSGTTDWRAGTKMLANLPTFGISSNTYFFVDEVHIVDLGAGVLRSYVTAIRRDDSSFSTQRKEDYIDFFSDLVAKAKEGASSEGNVPIILTATNLAAKTLTTSSLLVMSRDFTLQSDRGLAVDVCVPMTCSASQTITMLIKLNGDTVKTLQQWAYVDTGTRNYIMDVGITVDATASDSNSIAVYMQVDASTATVAAEAAELRVMTRGLEPAGVNLYPEIECSLTLFDPMTGTDPVPTLDVSAVAGSTISKSLTTPNMVGAPSDSLLVIYERNQTGDDSYLPVYSTVYEAQTFTVGVAHTCDKVMAKCFHYSDPGTITAEIRAVDGGGLPTGAALASGTRTGTDLPATAVTGERIYFDLGAGTALSASTKYALTLRASSPGTDSTAWGMMGAVTGVSQASNRNFGWSFTLSANRNVTHLSIYPRNSGTYKLQLWAHTGSTLLGSVTDACTALTWNHLALASPIALTAGATYVVSYNYTGGTGYHRRAAPAATEFHPEVTFVAGRLATAHDTYPGTADSTNANGVMGFKFDAPGRLYWRNDASSPTYANGARVGSTNSGTSWTEDTTRDFIFEEGDQQ